MQNPWHSGLALKPGNMVHQACPPLWSTWKLFPSRRSSWLVCCEIWCFSCSYNFCSTHHPRPSAPTQMVFIRIHCFWKENCILIKGWLSKACLQMRKIKQLLWTGPWVSCWLKPHPHAEALPCFRPSPHLHQMLCVWQIKMHHKAKESRFQSKNGLVFYFNHSPSWAAAQTQCLGCGWGWGYWRLFVLGLPCCVGFL